jgi:hypothetical protein
MAVSQPYPMMGVSVAFNFFFVGAFERRPHGCSTRREVSSACTKLLALVQIPWETIGIPESDHVPE